MIPSLASPSVCVIDDERDDYEPILDALMTLGLGCVHVKGDHDLLPPKPFSGLRIVFTDLHLSGVSGDKNIASHTAGIFKKVVSAGTAPVLVVIWSKYAEEPVSGTPKDDGITLSKLFQNTLLAAEPQFADRLIFIEMQKPKLADRSQVEGAWLKELQSNIEDALRDYSGLEVLWVWEHLVREAGLRVSEGLTTLAQKSLALDEKEKRLDPHLQLVLRMLVQEQGGPDCTEPNAPRHLASALAYAFVDNLEHSEGLKGFSKHSAWLVDAGGLPDKTPLAPEINSFLLTAAIDSEQSPLVPGTVYVVKDVAEFAKVFGEADELIMTCSKTRPLPEKNTDEKARAKNIETLKAWTEAATPVVVELSPACDVAQGERRSAFLLGGVIVSASQETNINNGETFRSIPSFTLRWHKGTYKVGDDVCVVICSRFKATVTSSAEPPWLEPWFRLREFPTASLRNWYAGHASRVGYLSFKAPPVSKPTAATAKQAPKPQEAPKATGTSSKPSVKLAQPTTIPPRPKDGN